MSQSGFGIVSPGLNAVLGSKSIATCPCREPLIAIEGIALSDASQPKIEPQFGVAGDAGATGLAGVNVGGTGVATGGANVGVTKGA